MSTLAIYETDSADHIFFHGFKAITRVLVDDDVGDFAKGPMKAFDLHRETVLAHQKSQQASTLAAAYLNRAQMRTDREVVLYSQRRVTSLGTHRKKGEKTPEYNYLFRGRTAATLLPTDDLQRREDLKGLVRRAGNAESAGASAFAELGALSEAIEAEKCAFAELQRANEVTEDAAGVEKNARTAVVVSIRAMNKDVQSFFAEDPAIARRLLEHGNPVVTRRRNERLAAAAEAEKAAKEKAEAEKAAADAAIEAAVSKAIEPKKTAAPCADAPLAIVPVPAETAIVPDAAPQSANGNGATGSQLDGVPPLATLPPKATQAN